MVSCCDSRVDPAIITNSRPAEIFMIRNVANIVPPCEIDTKHHGVSAGLEYAVTALNVDTIIIMGHSDCGGIKSLFTDNAEKKPNMFIDNWLDHLQILAKEVKAVCNHLDLKEKVTICSKKSILHSVDNLLSFPFIKERYDANLLNIFGWYFEIDDAKLIQIGRNGEHIEL